MSVRETIDIEALLVRAYREKAVDRLGMGDERSERALGRLIGMGAPGFNTTSLPGSRVDTSSFAARRASRERELMAQLRFVGDPLIRLHDAVLALPDFFVETTGDLDFVVWDGETAAQMGHVVTVEPYGRRATIQAGEEPARLVRQIVATNLVIQWGRSGVRVDPSPVVAHRGRAIYDHRKQVTGYEPAFETPLDVVRDERADYAVWRAAVDMLAMDCRVILADLDVQRPAAPVCPWAHEPDAALIQFGPRKRAKITARPPQAA